MSDTRQLEALRAAMDGPNPITGPQPLCVVTRAIIDRAIASLSAPAAEQPRTCAGFACGRNQTTVVSDDGTRPYCGCGLDCPCRECGVQWENHHMGIAHLSAHQQPPAEQAQQPAKTTTDADLAAKARGVARCLTYNSNVHEAAAKHLLREMAHRLERNRIPEADAQRDQRAKPDVGNPAAAEQGCIVEAGEEGFGTRQQPAPADVPPMPHVFTLREVPGLECCEAKKVRALHAACVRIARERDKWLQRTVDAEETLRDREADLYKAINDRNTAEARADKAEAELAALKRQYPRDWLYVYDDEFGNEVTSYECPRNGVSPKRAIPLYAAPVPAPDSIPLAQHEAALAQARREERARVSTVLDNRGWHDVAAVVAALPDAGGEGKP